MVHWTTGGRVGLREKRLEVDQSDDRYPLAATGGVPERKFEVSATDTVIVFGSLIFADGFESADTSAWSAP